MVVLGAVVLVIAIIALREPRGHVTSVSSARTVTLSSTPTTPATSTPHSTPAPTTRTSTSTGTSSGTSSGTTTTSSDPKAVPLIVLNNSGISGLARGAAQRFESAGWTVTSYDNLQNTIISTCAYYDPDSTGAKQAAQALQQEFPTIKRVRPRFSELPAGPVVVVLTSGYSPG